MALTAPIEVQAGADSPLRAGLWASWLAALVSSLVHLPQLPWWLVALTLVLLCWSFPGRPAKAFTSQRMLLHPNGQVTILGRHDLVQCTWHRNIWRSPLYTAIRIEQGGRHWQAWISARNNSANDYRRLGVWSRFSPQRAATIQSP